MADAPSKGDGVREHRRRLRFGVFCVSCGAARGPRVEVNINYNVA